MCFVLLTPLGPWRAYLHIYHDISHIAHWTYRVYMLAFLYRLGVPCSDMLSAARGAGCDDLSGCGCASAGRTKIKGADQMCFVVQTHMPPGSMKWRCVAARLRTRDQHMFRFPPSGTPI